MGSGPSFFFSHLCSSLLDGSNMAFPTLNFIPLFGGRIVAKFAFSLFLIWEKWTSYSFIIIIFIWNTVIIPSYSTASFPFWRFELKIKRTQSWCLFLLLPSGEFRGNHSEIKGRRRLAYIDLSQYYPQGIDFFGLWLINHWLASLSCSIIFLLGSLSPSLIES